MRLFTIPLEVQRDDRGRVHFEERSTRDWWICLWDLWCAGATLFLVDGDGERYGKMQIETHDWAVLVRHMGPYAACIDLSEVARPTAPEPNFFTAARLPGSLLGAPVPPD